MEKKEEMKVSSFKVVEGKVLRVLLEDCLNVSIIQNDITNEKVDCIVNAANSLLRHGKGLALAIVKKGGK